ncbi:hypothetical protein T484DRAFT_1847714 [Baffinella frigidus]|nr:hypothetical protein T484DRAFT_1847714 [Cryptophyta sp. CCMP2293]
MPVSGGSKGGGRGLELSLQMWVNSVLPADMSLKNLDDALAAPLVVPLFVQVLAGCQIEGLLKDPSPWSEEDRQSNWNATITFLRRRGCAVTHRDAAVTSEDAAVPFFWRLALHFLIAPQFGGYHGPASGELGPTSGDEADGPASEPHKPASGTDTPASGPHRPASGRDGPASGGDGPASELVAAGLTEKAHEWVAGIMGVPPETGALLGKGGGCTVLTIVSRAWPEP